MREMISVTSRRLEGPRRCTTQPPQLAGVSEPFKSGYLELAPEVMERLLSTDKIEDHYEVESLPFARGKYATVRRCRHRKTGVQYAAKYLKKRRRSTDLRYEILHEVAVLHACAQCPRIVNLIQVFETTNEMILVLELAPGGELQTLLDNDEIPEEKVVKRFMRQILDGLEFLHSVNVAHLDIKPQNLVLTSEFPGCDVKLCDFGISRYIGQSADIREILGTPDYVAPEVLNYEAISLATDMWSVGVLLYVLLTGCSPFGGDTKQETFCNISQCRLDFPDDLFEDISEDAKDLMRRLMVKDSSSRLTATECLQHSWFQTTELPASMPSVPESSPPPHDNSIPSNVSEVLVRTPECGRKMTEVSVKRTSSIRRTPEVTRKTIECVWRSPETTSGGQLAVHDLFNNSRTPDVVRKSFQTPEPARKLCESNPLPNKGTGEKNSKLLENTRKHSFNESLDDFNSIREKTRKISKEKEKPFENRRQTSMRDLSRRSSFELLVNGISKKRQTSFRETIKRNSENNMNCINQEEKVKLAEPKNSNKENEGDGIKKNLEKDRKEKKVEEEEEEERGVGSDETKAASGEEDYHQNESSRKNQTLHRNLKFFLKNEDSPKVYIESFMKKALSAQTLPIHPMFQRNMDKTIYKCKRIFIDDEIGNNATILIPVSSGQSSMSSISGTSSETSSITSDTVSEMSVDSSGDCSSFVSSDDSLDYVYKGVWDSGLKTGKVWIKECKGSFERALSRFNLEKPNEANASPTPGTGGGGGGVGANRRYQKNSTGLNRRSIYMSSPILNKIGNLSNVGGTDTRKYGVQLMKEGSGNLVVIREVKAGRYTKFSEVKCESVQSRIKKLQDQKG